MNTTECDALEHLAHAAKALMAAKRVTRNGMVDDSCVKALEEIKIAMNVVVNDTADE